MIDKPKRSDPLSHAAEPAPMSLQRERELVRSGGTISKHVMAIAFGLAFVASGLAAGISTGQWPLAAVILAVGLVLLAWGIYRGLHRAQQHTS